ncbi:substrate-binding domain-containing protein, partial [Photorhabdus aegyptia]|uniref:substrate-binding domain-containing protein n=1 Tax=Photorhabdus aegyptia TaxID=2805098 RepID=UPI001E656044
LTLLKRFQGFVEIERLSHLSFLFEIYYWNDTEFLTLPPEPPEAVFAGNDAMAVGAYQALYQAGLSIPDDISIIGYDDIDLAPYMIPPLTTIHQPKDKLGKLAVDTLLYRMNNPESDPKLLVLTPTLIERSSVSRS